MRRLIKWSAIVLGVLVGLAVLAGVALYPIGMGQLNQSYPNVPVETVTVPTGPDVVARGSHVAIVWGCAKCHGEDLSGKLVADDPILGTIPSSNLTSGQGGIGTSYTDTDWVRAIRHGVKPDGRVEVMMYDYSSMSDQDLGTLIAYLRQLPPVSSNHPEMRTGLILPIASAAGLLTPAAERIDHDAPRAVDPAPGATVDYGAYLSATCTECHGSRLTSLLRKVEAWQQDDFIRAFQTGTLPNGKRLGSSMDNFGEMNEMELTALWLYLQSLQSSNPPYN